MQRWKFILIVGVLSLSGSKVASSQGSSDLPSLVHQTEQMMTTSEKDSVMKDIEGFLKKQSVQEALKESLVDIYLEEKKTINQKTPAEQENYEKIKRSLEDLLKAKPLGFDPNAIVINPVLPKIPPKPPKQPGIDTDSPATPTARP